MTVSFLDIVNANDSISYDPADLNEYYKFQSHTSVTLGLVLPEVAEHIKLEKTMFNIDETNKTIRISESLDTFEKRNKFFASLLLKWRDTKTFVCLEGWRNECCTVYCPSKKPYLLIERAGAGLFGFVTYGVHIVGYVPDSKGVPSKIWVPRRSYSKPTYPGLLDNTVAGGIGYPRTREQTVIEECKEEADLDEMYVKSHIRSTGVVSYFFRDPEASLFQPEIEYTYELIMENGIEPRPSDGEVHEFKLMTINQVIEELSKSTFKYNAALITIDFLIRHGFITPEKEPNYHEIVSRMHRKLDYPVM